jgi:type III pantothenate kinase
MRTGARVIPFMTNASLARYYRAADIAVWPTQESMSMLDAAASGLPVVVSDATGEPDRVKGNGMLYRENDVDDLARILAMLGDPAERRALGRAGRERMLHGFSWRRYAGIVAKDFSDALERRGITAALTIG